jgi:hypothetical protein
MLSAPSPIAATLRAQQAGRVSLWVDRDDVPWCEPTDAAIVVRTSKQRLSVLRFVEEGVRSIGGYGFRDPPRPARAFEQGATAYALAGVTHFVLNTWETPPFIGPTPELTAVNDVWLWRASGAFERSWFVGQAVEATEAQALEALAGPAERFHHEVLREGPSSGPGARCESTVALTEPRPELVIEQVDACQDGYLVLADSWYPGWQVTIDGGEASPFKADFFLRGVAVPKGHHEVIWRYDPWSVRLGAWLSVLAFASMAIASSKRFGHLRA